MKMRAGSLPHAIWVSHRPDSPSKKYASGHITVFRALMYEWQHF